MIFSDRIGGRSRVNDDRRSTDNLHHRKRSTTKKVPEALDNGNGSDFIQSALLIYNKMYSCISFGETYNFQFIDILQGISVSDVGDFRIVSTEFIVGRCSTSCP